MRKITIIFLFFFLHGLVVQSYADETVISGLPTIKVVSSADGTFSHTLSDSESQKNGLLITKKNGEYYWESRGNRKLIHTRSGAFDLFIDPKGGGYIKVVDQKFLMEKDTKGVIYFEHMSLLMGTITYWGKATGINL